MGSNDGIGAMHACGVLLACQDDKAAQFEQMQELRHLRGQDVGVRRGMRLSLRGALVLAATAVAAMRAMTRAAAATQEVVSQRHSDIRYRQSEGVRGRQRWCQRNR